MANERRYAYAKFKVDKSTGRSEGYIVGNNQVEIAKWRSGEKPESPVDALVLTKNSNLFLDVANDFERTTRVFSNAVPFLMTILPVMVGIYNEDRMRGYIKKNGHLLESEDGYEMYQIDDIHSFSLRRRAQEHIDIDRAVENLPKMHLIGLVSSYDNFLAGLIKAIFLTKPEILSSSDRNMSFKDLVEIGSIEDARNHIMEKEVESVMRQSHADQISWLENKIGISLRKELAIWPSFIEICERRNLLTHADGRVSSQYMHVCKQHSAHVENIFVGQLLEVDAEYYKKSVDVVTEMGMKLAHVIWRKMLPGDIAASASALDRFGYSLIVERQYNLAEKILGFALRDMKKHGTEAIRKRLTINYANALRFCEKNKEAKSVLEAEDWSASSDNYKICVAAILGEDEKVISLMRRVVDHELLRIEDFRQWPVFRSMRSNPKFRSTFEEIFGEALIIGGERNVTVNSSRSESSLEEDVDSSNDQSENSNNNFH